MGFFDKLRDGRQDKVFEEKLLYLKKYHRDAELISYKVENIVEIPESWKKIFCMNKKEERSAATIKCWKALFANELRNTILYLEENLLDVNLIKYQGKYSILYSILSSNKKVLYYEGGNCNTTHFPGKLQSKLDNLPNSIVRFYQELHNGFFYYASGGMGLLESNDIVVFDDEENKVSGIAFVGESGNMYTILIGPLEDEDSQTVAANILKSFSETETDAESES